MINRLLLSALALASTLASLHAQSLPENPEPFAKELFAALKDGKSLDDYRVLPRHKPEIVQVFARDRAFLREGMTRVQIEELVESRFGENEAQFPRALQEVRSRLKWKKAKLLYVLYELEKHGEHSFEARIEITFEYKGEEMILDLDESILLTEGWKLADNLHLIMPRDQHDWEANEYAEEYHETEAAEEEAIEE